MKFILLSIIITLFFSCVAFSELNIHIAPGEQPGRALVEPGVNVCDPIQLPPAPLNRDFRAIYLSGKESGGPRMLENDVIKSLKGRTLLQDGEYSAFVIDTRDASLTYYEPDAKLSEASITALNTAPLWLEDQLRLKLRLLASVGLDDEFAAMILNAPEKEKDEVAFLVAYMSFQSLTNSRFLNDKEMILRTADFIYKIADSLQYVKLVEHGSFSGRDYYTTTSYRIYDPVQKDTIWNEIPKEIYYFYIVHPKMDQEGVFVKDNGDNNSGQRTYGYDWRTFIWNNPDQTYSYTQVNKTTTRGTISTIPRFGELLKKPRILWDRKKTYFPFNREFKSTDHALDVIGNWASQAVPVDVTLPRCFQPNQILIKHDGNCNEDAFLVTAACRTALIPLIYLGTWSQDHVFGAFWDQDWNHFEFFRGGLSPSGNEFYGITNMLDRGSYGWLNAFVEGFRPDGMPLDFTKYYANTCKFKIHVVDSAGNPIEGAMLNLFAGPSAYSQNPAQAGRVWTDCNGEAEFLAGEKKQYLVQAYHPLYGWSPSDSTKAYYLTNFQTSANAEYDVSIPFPVRIKYMSPENLTAPETAPYGIHAKWSVQDILKGTNPHDSQKSQFFEWNRDLKGAISFFLCDSVNYELFKKKKPFTSYSFNQLTAGGDINIALPKEGKWYAVFSNHNFKCFYQIVESEIQLVKDANFTSAENSEADNEAIAVSPNPFSGTCSISTNGMISSVKVCNSYGEIIETLQPPFSWTPTASVPGGAYFFIVETGNAVKILKSIYLRN